MTRSAPFPTGRSGLLLAALAAAVALAAPASAQEILQRRAPSLVFRPAPLASELATRPPDPLARFDPRLGIVTERAQPYEEITGQRLPVVEGADLQRFLAEERARRRSRLWTATIAERLSGRERQAEGLIPDLENPLKVPQPLARVFGEGSDFDVEGRLHLSAVGSRATQNPDLRSELLRRVVGGFDVDLDEILDLRILGTVGTKLDVAVDFNSTRELESKQLITATYTGTEDEIVKKYRYSGFLPGTSDLAQRVRARGCDTVVIAGTLTNVCCESSARDAMMRGFRVLVVSDANATRNDDEHVASLVAIHQVFGDVRTTDDILELLRKSARSAVHQAR